MEIFWSYTFQLNLFKVYSRLGIIIISEINKKGEKKHLKQVIY